MKKRALLTTLVLSTLTCVPDQDPIAKADRPRDEAAEVPPEPTLSVASRVWQASVVAETAGNFEAALSGLAQLPSPQREGYLASFRRGWLLYRLGRYADSVAAYNVAVTLEPAGVEARVALTMPLMALTKWDDVARAAQDALKRDPENYLANSRMALAKFSTQHYAEAELLYRHLVQLYPADVEMRASLGWTLLRMGKQKEAAELFSQVLEIAATHVSAAVGYREATSHKKGKH